jgi:hypothetical protein
MKKIPTLAPIGILMLIGILLLSALLYHKSVRAQRFLEPSLALAKPRIEFANNVNLLFQKEFGPDLVKGVVLYGNSIFVDSSLIFDNVANPKVIDTVFVKKLSNIFLSMLGDPAMRSHFDLILVSSRVEFSPSIQENRLRRRKGQYNAQSIIDYMYIVVPSLMKYYGTLAPTVVPNKSNTEYNWVEFKIVPSERAHVQIMESLEKYFD